VIYPKSNTLSISDIGKTALPDFTKRINGAFPVSQRKEVLRKIPLKQTTASMDYLVAGAAAAGTD
jgi:formylmethanofuran dehydrogenase subunit E